jgi:hypothetical protein
MVDPRSQAAAPRACRPDPVRRPGSANDPGMEVQVVRHHGRADDAERDVKHLRIGHDIGRGRKARDHRAPVGVGHRDLHEETGRDYRQKCDDEGLDPPKSLVLQPEDQEHVGRGDEDADLERDAEQKVQADGRADHLREVGGDDRRFGKQPERHRHPARKGIPASLRQVAARGDGEPRAERLQKDRHDVRQQRNEEQRVAEGRPRRARWPSSRGPCSRPRRGSPAR